MHVTTTLNSLLAAIFWLSTTTIALAHGGGGSTRSYQPKKPPLAVPTIPKEDTTPVMVMEVVAQTIRLTFNDALGDPVNVEMAEARAFVSSASGATMIRLLPTSTNVLSGKGNFSATPDLRVDISLRLVGKRPINKTFYPLQ